MSASLLKPRLGLIPVILLMLCLVPISCSSSSKPTPDNTALDAMVGYWRPLESKGWEGPKLLKIGKAGDAYTIDAPPVFLNRCPLAVKDGGLVFRLMYEGKENGRVVFSAGQNDELVWTDYQPGSTDPIAATRWKRATGSEARLSEELRCWEANNTIQDQVTKLANAFNLWAHEHGGQTPPHNGRYPPRKAVLPGGTFWKWKHAPHLTNAITGGPLKLGPGAGNFEYNTNAARTQCKISGHLYGGGESTQSEWRSP